MSKFLITGSTASQCSIDANKRSARFTSLLNNGLNSFGHDSRIISPSFNFSASDAHEYDAVIVGLAPFTSLSANKIYSALVMLNSALEVGNAKIIFDAPEPNLVYKSFRSVLSNPSMLFKSTYSSRSGYAELLANPEYQEKIYTTMQLVVDGGITTIIPSLPYVDYSDAKKDYELPQNGELVTINLDSMRTFSENSFDPVKQRYWSSDSPNTKWIRAVEKTLSKPVLNLKRTAYDYEADYVSRLRESYGFLLSTYKNDMPWWSPNIMLSLSCGTPVFSDWRLTKNLGSGWVNLPSDAESFSSEQKSMHSERQMNQYLSNLEPWDSVIANSTRQILS